MKRGGRRSRKAWRPSAASVASVDTAAQCAATLQGYLDAGADALILHGATAPHLGSLVEFGDTDALFTAPRDQRTQDYITGRFG